MKIMTTSTIILIGVTLLVSGSIPTKNTKKRTNTYSI